MLEFAVEEAIGAPLLVDVDIIIVVVASSMSMMKLVLHRVKCDMGMKCQLPQEEEALYETYNT